MTSRNSLLRNMGRLVRPALFMALVMMLAAPCLAEPEWPQADAPPAIPTQQIQPVFPEEVQPQPTEPDPQPEVPAEAPAHSETGVEIPLDPPATTEIPADTVETPAEAAVEAPATAPVEAPVAPPAEAAAVPPAEVPAEVPIEAPVEAPVENPVEAPAETPVIESPAPEATPAGGAAVQEEIPPQFSANPILSTDQPPPQETPP